MLRRILFTLGYTSLTVLVVGVTAALVASGNGYTYDFSKHRIIQQGLVLINSSPNGVSVSRNGKDRKKTPLQGSYEPGTYNFELTRDGYWPWHKSLQVLAGEVTLVKYAILVPINPTHTVLDRPVGIVSQSLSKDHRHLAFVTSGAQSALYTLDVGGKSVKVYTPKAAIPASAETPTSPATPAIPAEVLAGVIWSDDASHVLVWSTVGDLAVQRLMAADGTDVRNITEQYGFNFSDIRFSSGNWHQLYWVSPDGLRRLDVGAQSVSSVLADKVSQFWIEPDRVLYVQQTELGRSLWSLDSHGQHQELIQALAESDTYSVALSTYLGADELVVVPAKTQTGTLYTDIFGSTPVAKTIAHGVSAASFSADGHLVAFSSPTSIATYDLERSAYFNRLVRYDITDQPGQLASLTWFDNFHLLAVRDGHVYLSEFDGANRIDLGEALPTLPAYGTADKKSVLVMRPVGAGVQIEQIQIKQ